MGEMSATPFKVGTAAAAILLLFASVALGGCVANSYAGISLTPGAGDPELQELAGRAQNGDKRAQLELGIRYEGGRGVAVDLDQAERLYRSAATQTGGRRMAYVPAVGSNGRAATVPISGGRPVLGLPEAAARLASLQARRSQ